MNDIWDILVKKYDISGYTDSLIIVNYEIFKELHKKAEKFDRYNLHKISLEENGVWGAINKLDAKIEAIKPLVLELFNHADHGLDSHNPRSFEIRQLRDKIIRTLGETQA